jgi:hypothetical protein
MPARRKMRSRGVPVGPLDEVVYPVVEAVRIDDQQDPDDEEYQRGGGLEDVLLGAVAVVHVDHEVHRADYQDDPGYRGRKRSFF